MSAKNGGRKRLFLRRSCITGKVVWAYRGFKKAERNAYYRACEAEIRRIRDWAKRMEIRKANILHILGDGKKENLTDEQREAARKIQAISRKPIAPYTGFYDHVIEERRRRAEDKEIRRQMRERQKEAK